MYGSGFVRPNHHYATHVVQFVRDFGPLYGFWTFCFERLNRILKSFNTNNHPNGDLEETFLREFLRMASMKRLVSSPLYQSTRNDSELFRLQMMTLKRTDPTSLPYLCAQELTKNDTEERGTVADLAKLPTELDEVSDVGAYVPPLRHHSHDPMQFPGSLIASTSQLDFSIQRFTVPSFARYASHTRQCNSTIEPSSHPLQIQ